MPDAGINNYKKKYIFCLKKEGIDLLTRLSPCEPANYSRSLAPRR